MIVSLSEAREVATRVLGGWQGKQPEALALGYVQEYPSSWVLSYNSQAYLETGALDHALAGDSGPIVISKLDGSVRLAPNDQDIEEYLQEPPTTEWVRLRSSES